ncbi:hypothetical protein Hanom_Chr11g00991841 [Helianthus anomalus]
MNDSESDLETDLDSDEELEDIEDYEEGEVRPTMFAEGNNLDADQNPATEVVDGTPSGDGGTTPVEQLRWNRKSLWQMKGHRYRMGFQSLMLAWEIWKFMGMSIWRLVGTIIMRWVQRR